MAEAQGRTFRFGYALAAVATLGAAALSSSAPAAHHRAHCGGKKPTKLVGPGRIGRGDRRHANVIVGRSTPEKLVGGRGPDNLCGNGGADTLRGGVGRDRLHGGIGRDHLIGGKGRDVLIGRTGKDRIDAADGNRDRIRAGRGADKIDTRDGARDKVDCGRGKDTVRSDKRDALHGCYRVRSGPAMPDFSLPPWSDAGWSSPSNWDTIQTADLDGDGRADLFGRSTDGIDAYTFDSSTPGHDGTYQWSPLPALTGAQAPSDANGWRQPRYYETLQAADINGDGRDEIIGRDSGGIESWEYDPASESWKFLPVPQLKAFSNANGWSEPQYFETIRVGDFDNSKVNGHRQDEIVGRGPNGFVAYKYNVGSGQWQALPDAQGQSNPPSNAAGWGTDGNGDHRDCYTTLQTTGDIAGLGTGDNIVGRCGGGLRVWYYIPVEGGGWGSIALGGAHAPSDANGWKDPSLYSTIQTADLNGDGKLEVIGRDSGGLESWQWDPRFNRWDYLPLPYLRALSNANGFDKAQYYLTIHTADLNGDGTDDLYARGADGVHAWTLRNGDWQQLPVEGDFCDACSWNSNRYYRTIQAADVDGSGADSLIARGLTGVVTRGYDPARGNWVNPSAEFPPFTGNEKTAYDAINDALGEGVGPPYESCPRGHDHTFDLRTKYSRSETQTLSDYRTCVASLGQPSDVPPEAWTAVKGQVLAELNDALLVAGWFDGYLHPLIQDIYNVKAIDDPAAALRYDVTSNANIHADEWGIAAKILDFVPAAALGPQGGTAKQLLGVVLAEGKTAPGVTDALNGIDGNYVKIRRALLSDFTAALSGNADARQAILGDYGLLTQVGGLIHDHTWEPLTGNDRNRAVQGALRNYELEAWKFLTPPIWIAYRIPTFLCTSGSCDLNDVKDFSWQLSVPHRLVNFHQGNCLAGSETDEKGPCIPVSADLRHKLFDPTPASCETRWDADSCSLGEDPVNVFFGREGWDLPTRLCTYSAKPFCPEGKPARRSK